MTMMNRRQFVYLAAAGAAVLTRATNAFAAAADYDLIIKGGRVIDPSMRLNAIRDVAIAGNRIAGAGHAGGAGPNRGAGGLHRQLREHQGGRRPHTAPAGTAGAAFQLRVAP